MSVDDLIREFRIERSEVDEAAKARARAALMQAIAVRQAPASARRFWWHRERSVGSRLAVGLAVVAAAVIAVVLGLPSSHRLQPQNATAATLDRLAARAASGPDLKLGPGQYFYTKRDVLSVGGTRVRGSFFSYEITVRIETWTTMNDLQIERDTPYGSPQFPTAHDRTAWEHAGRPALATALNARAQNSGFLVGTGTRLTYRQIRSLSDDPTVLLQQLQTYTHTIDPWSTLIAIHDLLIATPVSPATESALIQLLKQVPGIRLDGSAKDALGRTGLRFSAVERSVIPAYTLSVIIDPDDSRLLDYEGQSQGTVALRDTLVTRSITNFAPRINRGVNVG